MRKDEVIWYKTPWGDEPQCKRCHADAHWVECDQCEDGYTDHDCGEDTCCCLNPEPNVICDICDGESGWYICDGCGKWECTCEPYQPSVKEKLQKAAQVKAQIPLICVDTTRDKK